MADSKAVGAGEASERLMGRLCLSSLIELDKEFADPLYDYI
jgi:hypothetical protein